MMAGGVPPLGPRTTYSAGSDHIYAGTGEGYEIRLYRPDGSLIRLVRRLGVDLAVTQSGVDSAIVDILRSQRPDVSIEGLIAAMPIPEQRAPYGDILVDGEGFLWVSDYYGGHYPTGPSPTGWDAFDPDGQWLGELSVPESFWVLEVGDDYVLGLATDAFGVQYVHMYGLER